jgi:hypothetical protein
LQNFQQLSAAGVLNLNRNGTIEGQFPNNAPSVDGLPSDPSEQTQLAGIQPLPFVVEYSRPSGVADQQQAGTASAASTGQSLATTPNSFEPNSLPEPVDVLSLGNLLLSVIDISNAVVRPIGAQAGGGEEPTGENLGPQKAAAPPRPTALAGSDLISLLLKRQESPWKVAGQPLAGADAEKQQQPIPNSDLSSLPSSRLDVEESELETASQPAQVWILPRASSPRELLSSLYLGNQPPAFASKQFAATRKQQAESQVSTVAPESVEPEATVAVTSSSSSEQQRPAAPSIVKTESEVGTALPEPPQRQEIVTTAPQAVQQKVETALPEASTAVEEELETASTAPLRETRSEAQPVSFPDLAGVSPIDTMEGEGAPALSPPDVTSQAIAEEDRIAKDPSSSEQASLWPEVEAGASENPVTVPELSEGAVAPLEGSSGASNQNVGSPRSRSPRIGTTILQMVVRRPILASALAGLVGAGLILLSVGSYRLLKRRQRSPKTGNRQNQKRK